MKRAFANFIFVLIAFGASDCTSVSSQGLPDANAAAVLDGRWNLDREASHDVRARLLPLLERNEQHWRQREEKFDQPPPRPDGATGVDEGVSHFRWLQQERQKEVDALIALLSPATQVDFQHKDGSIRIATNKSEGTRVVTPGERSSLFLSIGSFEVTSTWSHGSLRIESRGTEGNKLNVIEVFTPSGDTLEKQMEVRIPGISKQSFRIVYRR